MNTLHLLDVYPNRWGKGKVHILKKVNGYWYWTLCGRDPFGELKDGTISDVTCKICLKLHK